MISVARTLGPLFLVLSGCFDVRYVAQAAYGQLEMIRDARPIDEVIADPTTPDHARALLLEVAPIRRYAEENGLKTKGNYESYVDIDRRAAVWFVAVAPRLGFEPKEWCFPIVGCFPMLGWFDLQEALRFRREHRREGWDVYVRPARAFSTAGWFKDSVLSSMLSEDEDALADLVNVILHESVHANILIRDQAYFNESLAAFIGDGMTAEYLGRRFGKDSAELRAYREGLAEEVVYYQHMLEAYNELESVYESNLTDAKKLAKKKAVFDRLERAVRFTRRPNNATLVGIRTYRIGYAEFDRLFAACEKSWPRFIAAIETLGRRSFQKPLQEDMKPVILPLVEAGCPGD